MGVIKHQEHVILREIISYYSRNEICIIYSKGIEKQPYTAKLTIFIS